MKGKRPLKISAPDPDRRREIDALIYAEIRRRDRRNARFWSAALVVGIVATVAVTLIDSQPSIKALLGLIAFIGVFGFLAFLSTRKSLRGSISELIDR